jgi:glycolate oxidase
VNLKDTEKRGVVESLKNVLGGQYVSDEDFLVQVYSDDMTTAEPHPPDIVVMPSKVEEIQKIVRIANARDVPLIPFVNGSNVAGLTIPRRGGILLDLKRMDKIVEINQDCSYAVIEPGVTFGQLKVALDKHSLRNSIIYGPRNNSVLADYLSAGSGDLMTKYGNHAELITGLEVVLPTGEVVKTGSCVLSPYWFSLFPLPNLAGLFVGWLGTTGVVTKMGIKVVPLPKYRDVYDLAFDNIDDIVYPLTRIGRAEIAEIVVNSHWGIIAAKKERDKRAKVSKPPDLPETYFEVIVGGHSKEEVDYKRKIIEEIVEDSKRKGCGVSLVEIPEMEKKHHMDTPSAAPGMYTDHRGAGLEWVGSVMPISRWPSAYKRCEKIMEDYGFTPILDLEAEDNFHCGLFRAIIPFNKADPDEIAKTKELMKEVLEITLSEGGVIYKPPDWVADILRSRGDPGFFRLMKRLKELLDPKGIMNPGRWGF